MKTVIMAGGKGTRISSIASDIPKPMIEIAGKPVLEYEIECLKRQGYTDLIITVSHLGSVIMDYFGDGRDFGVSIEYYSETIPLGNAGALYELKDKLEEDFLLLNADSIFDVDLRRFVQFHKKNNACVTLLTHPNSHPYDSGLIFADKTGCVSRWISKEEERPLWYKNRVNAGIHVMSPEILQNRPSTEKVDLDRQLLKPLAGTGKLYCYDSTEYVRDMGTPERYASVCRDQARGIIESRNRSKKQKAIFLDRDGTINQYVGFLRDINDFKLIDGVTEAIKRINSSEYLVIVITNQPVIARGEVSWDELEMIHNKMETLLGDEGAYLDGIYFCPHHPDKGYKGEIKELKIKCACRKPKPGMLIQAAQDYNIDLEQSWMIGDGENDIKAGTAAGCKCIQIKEEYSLLDAINDIIGGQ